MIIMRVAWLPVELKEFPPLSFQHEDSQAADTKPGAFLKIKFFLSPKAQNLKAISGNIWCF